jgi:hypothetical protein
MIQRPDHREQWTNSQGREGNIFRKAKNIQEKAVKIFVDIFPDLY